MKNIFFLILIYLLPGIHTQAQQQDITGMWNGELLLTDSAGELVHLPYEIAVTEEKGKLKGYSRIVFHANGKDEAGVQDITIEKKGSAFIMEDEGFIDHQFSINPSSRVKKTMNVQLTVTEKEMVLEGEWSTNKTRRYVPMKGTVVLKRKNDFRKTALFQSLDTLNLVTKLSFKDRPSMPDEQDIAAVAPPAPSNNGKPVVVAEKEPEAIPDLLIPSVGSTMASIMPRNTNPIAPRTKITIVARPKKMQMDLLARSTLKPKPVAPKPAPVVVAAAPKPRQEPKEPVKRDPVRKDPDENTPALTVTPAPEKQPETVVAKAAPARPVPPPIPYIAPSVAGGAAELEKRITRGEQSFYFENDSLVITLYDNGDVDGDTVTVLMNGSVIFSKAGLSTRANTKTVYITPNMDSVRLVMYAESLGEIPPNTGLLIVNDGEKRYDVRFSADLNTNAAIVLRRKKNQ